MAGPHDRHRKSFFPVQLHQQLLTGNLVPGILPVGIGQRRPLIYPVIRQRFLVGRSRTDIDKLSRLLPEKPVIPLKLFRHKGDKIRHHIERMSFQFPCHRLLIVDICRDDVCPRRQYIVARTPVDQPQLVPFLQKPGGDCRADGAGSSDK